MLFCFFFFFFINVSILVLFYTSISLYLVLSEVLPKSYDYFFVCIVLFFSSRGVRCRSNSLSTFCYLAAQWDLFGQFVDRRLPTEVGLLCSVPHAADHHDSHHAGDEEDACAVYCNLHIIWGRGPWGFLGGWGKWRDSSEVEFRRRWAHSPFEQTNAGIKTETDAWKMTHAWM